MISDKLHDQTNRSSYWCVQKEYKFNDWNKINSDWNIGWNSSLSSINGSSEYVYHSEQNYSTVFIRNGNLVIRAYRQNGTYYAGRLSINTKICAV